MNDALERPIEELVTSAYRAAEAKHYRVREVNHHIVERATEFRDQLATLQRGIDSADQDSRRESQHDRQILLREMLWFFTTWVDTSVEEGPNLLRSQAHPALLSPASDGANA